MAGIEVRWSKRNWRPVGGMRRVHFLGFVATRASWPGSAELKGVRRRREEHGDMAGARDSAMLSPRVVASVQRRDLQGRDDSAGEGLTAFCCHRGRAWPHSWCPTAAPRAPAPSMPVRKYYSARRRHLPLDRTEQCCGVSLSTLTRRGSTDGHRRTTHEQTRILGTRPRHRRVPTTGWRRSMTPARACAMPAIECPDWRIASGNCGNCRNGSCGDPMTPDRQRH